MNVNAKEWTPSFGAAPAPAPTPASQPSPVDAAATPPAPPAATEDFDELDAMAESVDSVLKVSSSSGKCFDSNSAAKVAEAAQDTTKTASRAGTSETAATEEVEDEVDDSNVEDVDDDPRQHLNIVFIGHVDAGKSTLSGSILYSMGQVDKRTIERYEKEAKDRNRESWFLAFIMDTSEEERAKGKTVEVGRATFATDVHRYTILDAPGHKNYVPNMISGATQADVGVLVISARKGEFETGFEKGGQTREHALLAKTLGVRFLVVVINKMDDHTVKWSEERFNECVTKLKPFLKTCGYAVKRDVRFIPIAGLTGENVSKEVEPSVCPWWKGLHTKGENSTSQPYLFKVLDDLTISGRDPSGPLRLPVLDRYFERGTVVLGKVESGTITKGQEIVLSPTKNTTKVEAIYIDDVKVKSAKPGENVLLKLSVPPEDIQKGYVICDSSQPCHSVIEIKAQLALVDMLEHRPLFTPGYDSVMHVHTVEVECTCKKLISVVVNGKETSRPFARQGQMCNVVLAFQLPTCMDSYDKFASLGRITLRDEGKTIAIGKILACKVAPPK
jgi:peptide chain release factor subunit 3